MRSSAYSCNFMAAYLFSWNVQNPKGCGVAMAALGKLKAGLIFPHPNAALYGPQRRLLIALGCSHTLLPCHQCFTIAAMRAQVGVASIASGVQRAGGSIAHPGTALDEALEQKAAYIEGGASPETSSLGWRAIFASLPHEAASACIFSHVDTPHGAAGRIKIWVGVPCRHRP